MGIVSNPIGITQHPQRVVNCERPTLQKQMSSQLTTHNSSGGNFLVRTDELKRTEYGHVQEIEI